MKITKIYDETTSLEDMSKDRIVIDMSYNEWNKLRNLIDFVRWELPGESRLKKLAQNLYNCIKNAKELNPKWKNEGEE